MTRKAETEQKFPHPAIKKTAKMTAIALMSAALLAYPYSFLKTQSYFTAEEESNPI